VALLPVVVLGACNVAFPGTGTFPYPVAGLLLTLVVCVAALAPPLRAPLPLRAGAVLYALLAIGSFAISSPMGGNASRLAQTLGIPLLVCLVAPGPLRGAGGDGWVWRGAAALVLVPLVVWQWGPGKNVLATVSRGPATTAGFYRPLIDEVASRAPTPVRVEVVPTEQHWESVFVPPHDVVARGWERQIDIANNAIFYRSGALNSGSYRQWLVRNGVSFVALPNAPLDYAATGEGRLLRSGEVPGLTLVWHTPQWQLWQVDGTPGLVNGTGHVTRLGPDAVTLTTSGPGPLTLRVRWTRYWSVASGNACIKAGPGGWTTVSARGPGAVELHTTFDPLGGSGHC
jgi:hypothetical protein